MCKEACCQDRRRLSTEPDCSILLAADCLPACTQPRVPDLSCTSELADWGLLWCLP